MKERGISFKCDMLAVVVLFLLSAWGPGQRHATRCPRRRRQAEEACTCCTRTQAASTPELHTSTRTTKTPPTTTTTTTIPAGGRASGLKHQNLHRPQTARARGKGLEYAGPPARARAHRARHHLFRTGPPSSHYSCGGGDGHAGLVGSRGRGRWHAFKNSST